MGKEIVRLGGKSVSLKGEKMCKGLFLVPSFKELNIIL